MVSRLSWKLYVSEVEKTRKKKERMEYGKIKSYFLTGKRKILTFS